MTKAEKQALKAQGQKEGVKRQGSRPILQDAPDAYARTAAACGAFLDAFNCYMYLNT